MVVAAQLRDWRSQRVVFEREQASGAPIRDNYSAVALALAVLQGEWSSRAAPQWLSPRA
jgi:hypothetical protein